MSDLSTLQFVLFLLICGELTLFLVMNGTDFGAGIATFFVRDVEQRNEIIRVSSAVWFGNETWFVVGMATMFGAFPRWYAALASGYYVFFLVILVCFILRGSAFDYRLKWKIKAFDALWNWALFIGSLLPPFLFALVFTSALQGVPMRDEVVWAGFFDVVTPFTAWSGLALVLLSINVGLARVIKFGGEKLDLVLRHKLRLVLLLLPPVLLVEAGLLYFYSAAFANHPRAVLLLLLLCLSSVLASQVMAARKRDHLNFWFAALAVASFVILVFWSQFPAAIVGAGGNAGLALAAAASGPESQKWVAGASAVMLPLLALGQLLAYYYVNRDYRLPDTDINY